MSEPKTPKNSETAIIDRRVATPPGGVKMMPSNPKPVLPASMSVWPLIIAFLSGVLVTLLVVFLVAPSGKEKAAKATIEAAKPAVELEPIAKPTQPEPAGAAVVVAPCAGQCFFIGTLDSPLGSLAAGSKFKGSVRYAPAQKDGLVTGPNSRDYKFESFEFSLGGVTVRSENQNGIRIYDNHGGENGGYVLDMFDLYPTVTDAKFGGLTLASGGGLSVSLRNLTGKLFTSQDVPESIDVSKFDTGGSSIVEFRVDGQNTSAAKGTITAISGTAL